MKSFNRNKCRLPVIFLILIFSLTCTAAKKPKTIVSIKADQFFINKKITYKGRSWNGYKIEGLLFNSRMVQGVFDDFNPETADAWKYPDTKTWSADRNTNEFIAAMPEWKANGLLAFTINMQGGSPLGYGNKGWKNPGYDEKGTPIPEYLTRMEKIIRKADELGMVVILGYFYFGQDEFLENEAAVINATKNMTNWILGKGFRNVIVEIANEVNNKKYDHEILSFERAPELIKLTKSIEIKGRRLLTGVSLNGRTIPGEAIVDASDFILIHGNGATVEKITEMVKTVRAMPNYRPMPIVFNEDDHFDFDKPENNFIAAVKEYASWGYFDFRMKDESFEDGYQSVPIDWGINSTRKRAFFGKLKEITGY